MKPGCVILLESMWRQDRDPEIAGAYDAAHAELTAAGFRIYEIPMERECLKIVDDARRGKNMFALGVLCRLL